MVQQSLLSGLSLDNLWGLLYAYWHIGFLFLSSFSCCQVLPAPVAWRSQHLAWRKKCTDFNSTNDADLNLVGLICCHRWNCQNVAPCPHQFESQETLCRQSLEMLPVNRLDFNIFAVPTLWRMTCHDSYSCAQVCLDWHLSCAGWSSSHKK